MNRVLRFGIETALNQTEVDERPAPREFRMSRGRTVRIGDLDHRGLKIEGRLPVFKNEAQALPFNSAETKMKLSTNSLVTGRVNVDLNVPPVCLCWPSVAAQGLNRTDPSVPRSTGHRPSQRFSRRSRRRARSGCAQSAPQPWLD